MAATSSRSSTSLRGFVSVLGLLCIPFEGQAVVSRDTFAVSSSLSLGVGNRSGDAGAQHSFASVSARDVPEVHQINSLKKHIVAKAAMREEQNVTAKTPLRQVPEIRPQLFLLFMVYHKINNQAVWDRFLQDGIYGYDFQAIVHCVDEEKCRKEIRSPHFDIIPTVPTRYCHDLVGGMNALLKAAVTRGGIGSSYDKFVMLSDSTLPVKPFQTVYSRLTSHSMSDFCVFPRNEWAEVSQAMPGSPTTTAKLAVKHHQWIVFGRRHAEAAVQHAGQYMNLMETLQLNMGYANTGCLDEFWHFTVAYPDLHLTTEAMTVPLQEFSGGPLRTTNYEPQGQCDTFVHWVQRASGISNNVTLLARQLEGDAGTDILPPSETRPASIRRLSRNALLAMRRSDFLFARKVHDNAEFSGCENLDIAFSSVVFSPLIQNLPQTTQVWSGDGVWMDNQNHPVAIRTLHGAARLLGRDSDMEASGHYCGNILKVSFRSGYEAQATLSTDGKFLEWDNGVKWPRASSVYIGKDLHNAAELREFA